MRLSARERAGVIAVLAAMALVVLDAGLLTVALPSLAGALQVAPSRAILAVSAYQTALLVGLLPCAHLAERLGARPLFLGGLALFNAASLLCAFAPSLPLLVAARVVQGLGGAAIITLGIALLRLLLGAERLGAAIAWNALNVALCSAAAPILGALVLTLASWPWLFLVKLPVGAVALVAARALPRIAPVAAPVDVTAVLLHAATATLVLLAAEAASSQLVLAGLLAALAAILATLLVRLERTRPAPLWPLDLLRLRRFRAAATASTCCFIGQSAGLLALAFRLQSAGEASPLAAGLVMSCWPLAAAAAAPAAGGLAQRFGSAAPCAAGGGLLGFGLLLCALWPAADGIVPLALGAGLAGIGFGLFQVPNNRTLFLTVAPERSAAAGGLQGSARLLGQTLGALLVGLLFVWLPEAAAPRAGLAAGACFAIMAAMVSASQLPAWARAIARSECPARLERVKGIEPSS